MKKSNLSIVIPTLNEEASVLPLVRRINRAMVKNNINYEIIFIDDHSTDNTRTYLSTLKDDYPVRFYLKKGKPGKAFSLLEGFAQARYSITAMIDADLQYSPESIPKMYDEIAANKTDVVVANRQKEELDFTRKFLSKAFHYFFIKKLHGLDIDVQSGLKVFRTEIINRIQLNPTPWTFDLEFLLKAQDAQYRIDTVPIQFKPRKYGESKIKLFETSIEIARGAIKQKLSFPGIAPFPPRIAARLGLGFHFKGQAYVQHTLLPHQLSALYNLTGKQKMSMFFSLGFFSAAAVTNWTTTIIFAMALLTTIYFIDLLFYFYLIYKSIQDESQLYISKKEIAKYEKNNTWPTYTIFCPLYKESVILPQFIKAMSHLEYPKEKLQVLLLLEEDDIDTIKKAKSLDIPDFIQIVLIPDSLPKTKPKACNYGLSFATGEYSVIYDAEDIPDTLQLKKAVLTFGKTDPEVICVQAKLNFYNPHQNNLTRLFTAEYSLWFDLVLTGLQSIDAPIPLGGTSNHFKTHYLKEVRAWDAFNVTEDCDLGVRLAKEGYRTAIMNSLTLEEANSDLKNWFWQRTRWIKGYLQTYLVHMRHPLQFLKKAAGHHLPTFQLVVGGKIFLMLINPLMWLLTIVYFLNKSTLGPIIDQFFPGPVLYMGVVSLIIGNFLYFYYYMIGCAKRGKYELIKYVYLIPFYWLFMSAASWVALYQLLIRPHHWAKTKHGLHLPTIQSKLWKEEQLLPTS